MLSASQTNASSKTPSAASLKQKISTTGLSKTSKRILWAGDGEGESEEGFEHAPSRAPSKIPSAVPSKKPSVAPSHRPSKVPSKAPSLAPSKAPSTVPSKVPSAVPSYVPSNAPSDVPSNAPSDAPSFEPSNAPSAVPSYRPSKAPSKAPSLAPSKAPSAVPSKVPSTEPSKTPSAAPSHLPSGAPSKTPSLAPSNIPSVVPSKVPSASPSNVPSNAPSDAPSSAPSNAPSAAPSNVPSTEPSEAPSVAPSNTPSTTPSKAPSASPSHVPSAAPSHAPSHAPSDAPSNAPSKAPSAAPTEEPSHAPSAAPTNEPSLTPTQHPSVAPTHIPTVPTTTPTALPSFVPTVFYFNTTVKQNLAAAQVVSSVQGIGLNKPYSKFRVAQQLAQQTVKPNHLVSWVTKALNQFNQVGQKESNTTVRARSTNTSRALHQFSDFDVQTPNPDVSDYVTGALRASTDNMINDFRVAAASHMPFSAAMAQVSTFKGMINAITNPNMPLDSKVQLATTLFSNIGSTVDGLSQGAAQLQQAIAEISGSIGIDMSNTASVAGSLVDQLSSMSGLLGDTATNLLSDGGSALLDSTILDPITNGLDGINEVLQQSGLIQQDAMKVAQFMLGQITSVSMDALTQSDGLILSLSDTLNGLNAEDIPDEDAISSIQSQLSDAISGKLFAGLDIQDAMSTISSVGDFLGSVGDVVGAFSDVGDVLSAVSDVATGIGIAADAALMGGLLALGPVGIVANIAIGIGKLFSSIFGGSGESEEEKRQLQQISQQIGQVSKQIQSLGTYLGTVINDLGVHIDNQFQNLNNVMRQEFTQLNQNVDQNFYQLSQQMSSRFNDVSFQISGTNQIITTQFDNVIDLLDEQHKQILLVQGQLSEIQSMAQTIQQQVSQLTSTVTGGFTQLYSQLYEQMRVQTIDYYQTQSYGQVPPLDPTQVQQAFLSLVNWISVDTKNAIFHNDLGGNLGTPGTVLKPSIYSLSNLYITVSEGGELSSLNLLYGFLTTPGGYGMSINLLPMPTNTTRPFVQSRIGAACPVGSDNARIINPLVWRGMVTDLQQFIFQTPEFKLESSARCSIQQVVQSGEDFLGFILALKTNQALFNQLVTDYETTFNALVFNSYQTLVSTVKSTLQHNIQMTMQQLSLSMQALIPVLTYQVSPSVTTLRNDGGSLLNIAQGTCQDEAYIPCSQVPPLGQHPAGDGGAADPYGPAQTVNCANNINPFFGSPVNSNYCSAYGFDGLSNVCGLGPQDCNEYSNILAMQNFARQVFPDFSAIQSFGNQMNPYLSDWQFFFNGASSPIQALRSTLASYNDSADLGQMQSAFSSVQASANTLFNSLTSVTQCYNAGVGICASYQQPYSAENPAFSKGGLGFAQANCWGVYACPHEYRDSSCFCWPGSTCNCGAAGGRPINQCLLWAGCWSYTMDGHSTLPDHPFDFPGCGAVMSAITDWRVASCDAGACGAGAGTTSNSPNAVTYMKSLGYNCPCGTVNNAPGCIPNDKQYVTYYPPQGPGHITSTQTYCVSSRPGAWNNFNSNGNSGHDCYGNDVSSNNMGGSNYAQAGFATYKAEFLQTYPQYVNQMNAFFQVFEVIRSQLAVLREQVDVLEASAILTNVSAVTPSTGSSIQILEAIEAWMRLRSAAGSTVEMHQIVQAALLDSINSAEPLQMITNTLNYNRHALMLFLNLAFQQELSDDAYARQLLLNLWTGDQFIQGLRSLNTSDANDFVFHQLYQAFFPIVNDQALSVISTLKNYLANATAQGQALYAAQQLAIGHHDFEAVLQQLRDMRDHVFPMGLSILDVTANTILNAYQTNNNVTLQALNNMLVDLDMTDNQGNSALMLAVNNCDFPTVNRLITAGANLNLLNNEFNGVLKLALHCKTPATRARMMDILVKAGAMRCGANELLSNMLSRLTDNVSAAANVGCGADTYTQSRVSPERSISSPSSVTRIIDGVATSDAANIQQNAPSPSSPAVLSNNAVSGLAGGFGGALLLFGLGYMLYRRFGQPGAAAMAASLATMTQMAEASSTTNLFGEWISASPDVPSHADGTPNASTTVQLYKRVTHEAAVSICQPVTLDDQPVLSCYDTDYQALVMPHAEYIPAGSTANAGDHYSSCRPVSWYGQPSAYCEGEQTGMIYMPIEGQRPHELLDGQVMLGRVAGFWLSSAWSYAKSLWTGATNKTDAMQANEGSSVLSASGQLTTVQLIQLKLSTTHAYLNAQRSDYPKKDWTWFMDILEELDERLDRYQAIHENQITAWDELGDDIDGLKEGINDEVHTLQLAAQKAARTRSTAQTVQTGLLSGLHQNSLFRHVNTAAQLPHHVVLAFPQFVP